jgi:hypothetical protein
VDDDVQAWPFRRERVFGNEETLAVGGDVPGGHAVIAEEDLRLAATISSPCSLTGAAKTPASGEEEYLVAFRGQMGNVSPST